MKALLLLIGFDNSNLYAVMLVLLTFYLSCLCLLRAVFLLNSVPVLQCSSVPAEQSY